MKEGGMKKVLWLGSLSLALALCPLSEVLAYQGAAVKNGGTISGVISFKGKAPAPKKVKITRDKRVCAKTVKTDASLIVSKGKLVNAVVTIKGIKKGKKMELKKVVLDQRGCEYHPHVLAFPAGSTVEILNPDGVLHNVHSYSKVNAQFNKAQPKFKKKLKVKITRPEPINVKCDVHGWMNGWLFSAANPYFSVTDDKGGFKLTDVPAGTYTIEVWHETLGKKTQKVTVKANKEVKVNIALKKK